MSTVEFEVTHQDLKKMIVETIDMYNVLDVMRGVGLRPYEMYFTGAGDVSWLPRVGWSPNGVYNLFHGCDSIYHNKNRNQIQHWFYPDTGSRFRCIGTEINYYVQGALFSCFDCSYAYGEGIARTWKDLSGHGALTNNCVYFLQMGHSDLPRLWNQVLAVEKMHVQDDNALEHRRMQARIAASRPH